MRVELFKSPGCPNAAATKKTVTDCMKALGIEARVIERVGRYPSPTVLVNGVDVMSSDAGVSHGDACRLDLPSPQRILDALRKDPA
jgi:hypothetical protein